MHPPSLHNAPAHSTGGTSLARAKHTDRTAARRRHRAQQVAEFDEPTGDDVIQQTAPATPARRKGTAPAGSTPKPASVPAGPRPARPGMAASARAAYRPAKVREDLQALPRLLIHWSVLLSAGLAVVGTAVFLVAASNTSASTTSTAATTTSNGVATFSGMVVSLFVGTPPPAFGAALLLGWMLPRATWLVGLVYGALASACFTVLALASPSFSSEGSVAVLAEYWILGMIGTMFFAAGIAWYKRFLDQLNPNRGQRRQQQQKPQQGRGNAPRNRLSGSSR
jgi:hypothetical protein